DAARRAPGRRGTGRCGGTRGRPARAGGPRRGCLRPPRPGRAAPAGPAAGPPRPDVPVGHGLVERDGWRAHRIVTFVCGTGLAAEIMAGWVSCAARYPA